MKKWIIMGVCILSFGCSALFAQGLDFGDVAATETIQTESSLYPVRMEANIVIGLSILVLLGFCLWVVFQKDDNEKSLNRKFKLADLPVSAKSAMSLVWVSYGLVHVFAVATVYLKTNVAYESAKEYFFYMPVHKLTALSHAHFFGHATMYIITASLFLFTVLPERFKRLIVILAPLGAILDNAAWWGMKLASPHYELLSYGTGAMISIGFAAMATITCVQIWHPKYSKKEIE